MDKETLTFRDIEVEKKNHFTATKVRFLKDIDIEKVLVFTTISSGEKTVSTLLVTCMIIIKLNHYI